MVRCLHGAGENRDSRELAQELEMMIVRRVASYIVKIVEVMITNQDIIDINLLIFKTL